MKIKELWNDLLQRLRCLAGRLRKTLCRLPWLSRVLDKRQRAGNIEDISWRPATGTTTHPRYRRAFSLTRGMIWYIVLMVGALLFTQVLRSRASHIFFWFVLLMLPTLLIYTLIARVALRATLNTSIGEVEKLQPYDYEFVIENASPLAFPFVDAVLSLPREDAVRTEEKLVRLSMAPLSSYRVNNSVRFRFRGTYRIGVRCFYVYDFFRLFRVRVDVESYEEIYVMPRKREGRGSEAMAIADMTSKTTKSPYTYERLEISDIRDYRMGDSLKSIHWKLSSKSEEMVVRDYSSGVSDRTVIFCDMAAHYPTTPPQGASREAASFVMMASDEQRRRGRKKHRTMTDYANRVPDADMRTEETDDPTVRAIADQEIMAKTDRRLRAADTTARATGDAMDVRERMEDASPAMKGEQRPHALAEDRFYQDMNEYCADGVIELTVSTVLRELRNGNKCFLVWFDSRVEGNVLSFDLTCESDFDGIFRLFATAPLCRPEQKVSGLRAMVSDTQSIKQIFVLPALDERAVTEFSDMGDLSDGSTQGAVELLCYEPTDRFACPEQRRSFLENCRALLSASGIRLRVSHGVDADAGKQAELSPERSAKEVGV